MEIEIDYTNWRGERSVRKIEPLWFAFTSSPHHPGQQWLLRAADAAKDAHRLFAVTHIHRLGEWDDARERAMFEDAAYAHYLRVRAQRAKLGILGVLDGIDPRPRDELFARGLKGEYVAIVYQQAWGGWKLARGGGL